LDFGKRIGDGTSEAVSRLTGIGVGDSLEGGLERTERALAKLDEGTYGMCDVCGDPIARGQLRAMPDGVLCLDCAASAHRFVLHDVVDERLDLKALWLQRQKAGAIRRPWRPQSS
jgi:RNA polymerase-binding transcription factor DksA